MDSTNHPDQTGYLPLGVERFRNRERLRSRRVKKGTGVRKRSCGILEKDRGMQDGRSLCVARRRLHTNYGNDRALPWRRVMAARFPPIERLCARPSWIGTLLLCSALVVRRSATRGALDWASLRLSLAGIDFYFTNFSFWYWNKLYNVETLSRAEK